MADGGNPEIIPRPEAPKNPTEARVAEESDPTRASRSFLERAGESIQKRWRVLLPGAAIIALNLGFVDSPLMVKGLIAGAAVLPMAHEAYKSYRVNKAADAAEEAAEQVAEVKAAGTPGVIQKE